MKEAIEKIPAQTVEEAVQLFQEDDNAGAIAYLKSHKDDVHEFCMQVYERYGEDSRTGVYRLAEIIKELL